VLAVTAEHHRCHASEQISPVTMSVDTLAKLASKDGEKHVVGAGGASSSAGIRRAISGVPPAGPGPPPNG